MGSHCGLFLFAHYPVFCLCVCGPGNPVEEKGQVLMCGKFVASSMALYQLERSKAAAEEHVGEGEGSKPLLQIPPSPKPKLTGRTVNIILSYFSFERRLATPASSPSLPLQEPFLSITIGGHSLETERCVLNPNPNLDPPPLTRGPLLTLRVCISRTGSSVRPETRMTS